MAKIKNDKIRGLGWGRAGHKAKTLNLTRRSRRYRHSAMLAKVRGKYIPTGEESGLDVAAAGAPAADTL